MNDVYDKRVHLLYYYIKILIFRVVIFEIDLLHCNRHNITTTIEMK